MFLTVASSHLSINSMKLQQPVNNIKESLFDDEIITGFVCVCVICQILNFQRDI